MSQDTEQDAGQQGAVLSTHVSQCIDHMIVSLQDELGMDSQSMSAKDAFKFMATQVIVLTNNLKANLFEAILPYCSKCKI